MADLDWRATLVPKGVLLKDVIASLESSGRKIALAVDERDVLIGTISDGDVRRGLLRGLTLDSDAGSVINPSPLVVPPEMSVEAVLHLMQVNKLGQLPIIDAQRHVVGLHVWDELQEPVSRPNMMVIMAGGKGVRLGEHTHNCPKPMVLVGDKPMLQHIIERAAAEGFRRFHIAIRHLGHMIEDYFGDGSRLGVDIRYLREDAALGTCGALGLLDPLPAEPLLVTNGDVLTDLRYGEMLAYHERHTAVATMAVRSYEWEHPYGVIRTNGVDIVGIEEKPVFRTHVNAGIYVIEPRALALLPAHQACDIPTFFERLASASERTIVYPMHEPWLDVGRPFDLEEARKLHSAV